MIDGTRLQNALNALNRVLALARAMADERIDHNTIASVLDVAEYLPRLIADPADRTAAFFGGCLGDLAARWPPYRSALEIFDGDAALDDPLSSEDLTALIVDALLRPGIVKDSDVQRAIEIASEEIEVRKIMGDY